jgi:methanogen homocitrate synthase
MLMNCEYNKIEDSIRKISSLDNLKLHDITMRDGAHVVDFSNNERIELASQLSDLGVHRIEIESRENVIRRQSLYSPEDHWKTLKNIVGMGLKSDIYTMRNVIEGQKGIDESLKLEITHIELQEPVHRDWIKKLGQSEEERFEKIAKVIQYAKDMGCYIVFFNNHICDSDPKYLEKIIRLGKEFDVDSYCITDSEGMGGLDAFKYLTKKYIELSGGDVPVEIHAHNDFGLALANSLISINQGASVIHCSVNGLGSRAGNTKLEELIITLHAIYNMDLGLTYQKLYDVCKIVEYMQQWPIAKNKPFYGYGIHSAPYDLKYFGKKILK